VSKSRVVVDEAGHMRVAILHLPLF
jgi:hypothetical protein